MPKIDFYLVATSNDNTRFHFVCRLIEKAYKQQHRIYVHTNNQHDAHIIEELLWTFRDDSFLTHHLYCEEPEPVPPIQIGYNAVPNHHRDILINLNKNVPEFYSQFVRILEIVSDDTVIQAEARERFRFYRTKGLNISTH